MTFEVLVKLEKTYAEIMVDNIPSNKEGMDILISSLMKLRDLGFVYNYTDYSTGYYSAAEDITLNFTKK